MSKERERRARSSSSSSVFFIACFQGCHCQGTVQPSVHVAGGESEPHHLQSRARENHFPGSAGYLWL